MTSSLDCIPSPVLIQVAVRSVVKITVSNSEARQDWDQGVMLGCLGKAFGGGVELVASVQTTKRESCVCKG